MYSNVLKVKSIRWTVQIAHILKSILRANTMGIVCCLWASARIIMPNAQRKCIRTSEQTIENEMKKERERKIEWVRANGVHWFHFHWRITWKCLRRDYRSHFTLFLKWNQTKTIYMLPAYKQCLHSYWLKQCHWSRCPRCTSGRLILPSRWTAHKAPNKDIDECPMRNPVYPCQSFSHSEPFGVYSTKGTRCVRLWCYPISLLHASTHIF